MAGEDQAEQKPTIMDPNDTANAAKTEFLVILGPSLFKDGPGWFKSTWVSEWNMIYNTS